MRSLSVLALFAVVPLRAQDAPIVVPAFTGYATPDVHGMRREKDGAVTNWRGAIDWYGHFAKSGELRVTLRFVTASPEAKLSRFTLRCVPTEGGDAVEVTASREHGEAELQFPPSTLAVAGYQRLTLRCDEGPRPALASLVLEGAASRGAHFGGVERRNASSVHLGWQVPKEIADDVEWFYCEVTPRTDPLWTYYMATGWSRGYFGMQVNSETERRVIFSVWDAGNEAVDRGRVAEENRVQLVDKGDGVVAEGFGHEGTGGHSHLVRDWKVGDTLRFAVHAQAEDDHTTYSGWFWNRESAQWELIASFRAPKDGRLLHGLYSFNEDFAGENGDRLRRCEFGNAWVRTRDGRFVALTSARFTHDGHGRDERLDRSAGVIGDRLYLQNGGFVEDRGKTAVDRSGALLEIPAAERTPLRDQDLPIDRR
ncbi:MAG: DUF3472 domain-containing protein [Planctomycetota bacterium]